MFAKANIKMPRCKKVLSLSYQGNWVKERNKRGQSSQEATIERTVEFWLFCGIDTGADVPSRIRSNRCFLNGDTYI